jgi:hypothetical protein
MGFDLFRSFDTPMTKILRQLKTLVVDIPTGRSISATCLHKWMAQIIPRISNMDFPISCHRDSQNRECRYPDANSVGTFYLMRRVKPCAPPN